jgi:hypothetical protein
MTVFSLVIDKSCRSQSYKIKAGREHKNELASGMLYYQVWDKVAWNIMYSIYVDCPIMYSKYVDCPIMYSKYVAWPIMYSKYFDWPIMYSKYVDWPKMYSKYTDWPKMYSKSSYNGAVVRASGS